MPIKTTVVDLFQPRLPSTFSICGNDYRSSPGNHHAVSHQKLHWLLYCTYTSQFYSCTEEVKGSGYEHSHLPIRCCTNPYSDKSLEFLCRYFPGGRLLSRRTYFLPPTYSPDLNPPDYFLWEYLRERIYDKNLQILITLKDNKWRKIRHKSDDVIERVIKS